MASQPEAPTRRAEYRLRLLDVTAHGGNLLASRAVASPPAEPSGYVPAALVTPDGRVVITSEVQNIRSFAGRVNVVARVLELDASTSRTLRVLYTTTADHASGGANGAGTLDQECDVLALGPTATEPLVACFSMGVLLHGQLVSLPGIPSATSSGIAGQDAIAW